MASAVARTDLEALLRARKLDRTVTRGGLASQGVVETGIAGLDEALGGGLPRGQMSEVVGPRSSGRSGVMSAALAGATGRGELAALVDALDMFDPESAAEAGIRFERLLWIRGDALSRHPETAMQARAGLARSTGRFAPHQSARRGEAPSPGRWGTPSSGKRGGAAASGRWGEAPSSPLLVAEPWARALDRGVKALNLVLQAGGFDLVVLDLAEVPLEAIRRLPFTTWFRLQRPIEGSRTSCLIVTPGPVARSAGGVTIELSRVEDVDRTRWSGKAGQPRLFLGLDIEARIVRSRDAAHDECFFTARAV